MENFTVPVVLKRKEVPALRNVFRDRRDIKRRVFAIRGPDYLITHISCSEFEPYYDYSDDVIYYLFLPRNGSQSTIFACCDTLSVALGMLTDNVIDITEDVKQFISEMSQHITSEEVRKALVNTLRMTSLMYYANDPDSNLSDVIMQHSSRHPIELMRELPGVAETVMYLWGLLKRNVVYKSAAISLTEDDPIYLAFLTPSWFINEFGSNMLEIRFQGVYVTYNRYTTYAWSSDCKGSGRYKPSKYYVEEWDYVLDDEDDSKCKYWKVSVSVNTIDPYTLDTFRYKPEVSRADRRACS